MKNNDNKEVKFDFTLAYKRYESEDYKIYLVDIKNPTDDIKSNTRGEFVIVGDIPELSFNINYQAIATMEIHKTFGLQYKIKNIKQERKTDLESSRAFLSEILTSNQTNVLLEVYPNIIDMIINGEEVDLNKTKGIKDFTFKKIKSKIIDNYVLLDLCEEYNGILSFAIMKKLYEEYTSVELIKKAINENPYENLCSISGIGFLTADKIILELEKQGKIKSDGNITNSKFRMKASIDYILSENEISGNTKMKIATLRNKCKSLTPECIEYFTDIIKSFKNNKYYINEKDKTIGFYQTYQVESYIAMNILNLLSNPINYKINTELYREYNGIILTDEQMGVLNNINKYNISILTAAAGSGKSQTVSNLIYMLEDNNKAYIMMSPTGKAAKVLQDYTGKDVGTIHRKLGYNPRLGWKFNENNKLNVDVVIVDEASMCDIWLMKHLLEAIDTTKTKLLLVFDSYQLPSVSAGNITQDLLASSVIPTTVLTKIFRYNEGGLMQVATKIRNSQEFLPSNFIGRKVFGINKDFIYVELLQTKIKEQVAQIYLKLLKDGYTPDDIMIVTSQNKGDYGTREINKHIQELLQKNNDSFITRGKTKFYKGDKVVQTINNYDATTLYGEITEIYNGNTGIISDINYNEVIVDFGNGKLIVYDRDNLEQLELAYCTTIHKSQGASAKQVIVIAPKAHTFMLNSNLLYVGVTRAKQRVWCIGNITTINRAIKKKENLNRQTYLKEILEHLK